MEPERDNVRWIRDQRDRLLQTRPIEGGGGPPHDGGMEARVAKLEIAVEYIQRDMAEVRTAIAAAGNDVGTIKKDVAVQGERLKHIPTRVEMWGAVLLVLGSIGGGFLWVVKAYLGPLLGKMAGG